MWRNLWHYLSTLGLSDEDSSLFKRRIVLINRVYVLALTLCTLLGLNELSEAFLQPSAFQPYTLVLILGIILLSIGVLVANQYRVFWFGKFALLFVFSSTALLGVTLLNIIDDYDIFWMPYLPLVFSAIVHLIVDAQQERLLYFGGLGYNFGLMMSFELFLSVYPHPTMAPALAVMYAGFVGYKVGQVIIWVLVNGAFFHQVRLAEQFERDLAQKNEALTLYAHEIQEKNDEISQQNEELYQSQEELQTQRDFIAAQVRTLQDRELKINGSIRSALMIQQALLPQKSDLARLLGDYFMLYQPKDVVSGDFLWIDTLGESTIIAAIDCTGHGVPGAFMTLIGHTLLNQIIKLKGITDPAEILTQLHLEVRTLLRQQENGNNNGMDASLLTLQRHQNGDVALQFAGAKQAILYYDAHTKTLEELPGTRKAIGGEQNERKQFSTQQVILPSGSMVYAGSDGYEDQNDAKRRKFGKQPLRELLRQLAPKPLPQQEQTLRCALQKHMTNTEQRDDILLIGIRI
ncbi:PP2C family protein-serine/threonine phosphatase [Eisenibacter elegans]|uniref:PP2C family protein-serine/threonine phosphatase n=1 Tax=Eisenibacter elegans TaxID=997 RepID=UPI00040C3CC7|nr:SpoIIE family protein phosphatase [Eisenibacter elegans]